MTPAEQDMMAGFRRDYLGLLDDRVEKVRQLLAAGAVEPARVALLSLESSSAMVGADRLVVAVRKVRDALGDPDALAPLLAELRTEADAAREQVAGPGS